jgi:hypothetical protein
LFFLNNTAMPALLLEICFVDSQADADLYGDNFEYICEAVATVLGGEGEGVEAPGPGEPQPEPPSHTLFVAEGRCSYFGGPEDHGVSASEGLAFIYDLTHENQYLFLPFQPSGTTGLARRLNPYTHYVACRWDYNVTPKTMLANSGEVALVTAHKTGISLMAFPADWGPHGDTGRVADLSPSLMKDLGIETDDEVEVVYPYRED